MGHTDHDVAENIVQAFRSILDPDVAGRISDAEYTDLALMIRKALAEEADSLALAVEETARKIRASVQRDELEL
jgi:hypothetical protein